MYLYRACSVWATAVQGINLIAWGHAWELGEAWTAPDRRDVWAACAALCHSQHARIWQSPCSLHARERRVCAQHAGNAAYSTCAQRGVAYKPRKGDALLFYSLKPNGELDPLSLHGCVPFQTFALALGHSPAILLFCAGSMGTKKLCHVKESSW